MKSVGDTAKQDLLLVVAGLIALLLFFWLYPDVNPLPAANNSFGKSTARTTSAEIARQLGFESEVDPVTRFQIDTQLLDSLQKQTEFKEFYSNSRNKNLYPTFFWHSLIKMGSVSETNGGIFNAETAETITVRLSESGELISLENQANFLPQPMYRPEVLNYGLQGDSLQIYSLVNDSLITESLEFRFSDSFNNQQNNNRFDRNRVNYLGITAAQRMADYHLMNSGWPIQDFTVISTERVQIGELDGALVRYEHSSSVVRGSVQIDVRVLPSGGLVSLTYSHPTTEDGYDLFSSIKTGIRAIVLLIGAFWIVVLLFIRFRLRLVDIKAATLVAVLAGMIFPLVLTLEMVYSHMHTFGAIETQFVLMQLIVIGLSAAIATLGFFAVTAISDSITRQYWSEKLRTVDVLRVGYFNNTTVGFAIIRGISFGFVLAFTWCVLIMVVPGSFITLEANFESDTSYLPYLTEILGNFAFYFLIAQVIFLVFTGLLRSRFKSSTVAVLVPTFLFIIVYPFPFEVGSFTTEMITSGIIGVSLAYIYFSQDFLATFIALFVFVMILSTANGWLIEDSPDAIVFYSFFFLLVVGYIAGGYNIYRGNSIRELPRFVPEYIEELAQEDRIRQELKIARSVQQSFLPVETPNIEGYDIAAICKPAYETGGDYYDFISLQNNRLAITIGDVSGKGIQAAFFMTFTKGILHALCSDYHSTIDILVKANNLFRANASRGTFISLIFGILDLNNHQFKFSRAGHNPVLFYNNSENKLSKYQPEGIAIGMAGENIFRNNISEESINLKKEDLLVLFTDGVVESINKTNKMYGDKRLQKLIERNFKLSSKELLKKLEEDLELFGQKSNQHDDLTMIVIKKK